MAGCAVTGCYGSFPLTKAVYDLNGDITDSKVIHTLVLWGFVILPVYSLAMLGDAVILNLIEFWTGDTLEISRTYTTEDGTRVVLAPGEQHNVALLTIEQPDRPARTVRFVRQAGGATDVFDEDNRLVGNVRPDGSGGLELTTADGRVVEVIEPAELASAF